MIEFSVLIKRIENMVHDISIENHLPDGFLSISNNKNGSTSLWLVEPVSGTRTKMVFNIDLKGKKGMQYLRIYTKTAWLKEIGIPETAEIKNIPSDAASCYLHFSDNEDQTFDFIRKLITNYVNNFEPSEKFGCCHRYKECSNAKSCLHPDQFYAKACWYRKNLEKGKIFY